MENNPHQNQPQPPKFHKPKPVKYPKPKTSPNPPEAQWPGKKTFADVGTSKPKYSDADLEEVYVAVVEHLGDVLSDLADREATNEYRTYISATARQRLRKGRDGQ